MVSGYSYFLLPRAESEYLSSYLWYEQQREGLGDRYRVALRKKLQQVAANPALYNRKKGKFYEIQLGKPFPFVIIFVIDKQQRQVIVVSVFHTSRNPNKKYKK